MRYLSCERLLLAGALAFCFSLASVAEAQQPGGPPDAQIQTDLQGQLRGKQFRDVHAQVAAGVVTLTGSVTRLADKLDAEKRVNRTHEAASVRDQITVEVPPGVSDEQLFAKLGKALAYDRQGYGTLPFNSITLKIHDGVAEIGGEVVEPECLLPWPG